MRVLLVEDNPRLSQLIVGGLAQAGYAVDAAATLAAAEETLALGTFDLLLLDLGLPDGDGIVWLKALRQRDAVLPVLVITARGDLNDRIAGLDNGADDYIVKPFALDELLARCRAVLRRPGSGRNAVLSAGNLELHTATRQALVAGTDIAMPRREMALLESLLLRHGKVVSREVLEQALYNLDAEITPNAIEAQVSRLRRRLVDAGSDVSIHTVRGIGYLLRAANC